MVVYQRNRFTNPANGTFYDWAVNHDTEEQFGKARNIETTAPTGNVGLVMQQGSDSPLVMKLSGNILSSAQFTQMLAYYNLSRTQSINFTDFTGDSYEVVITEFSPVRQRTLRNPRDSTISLHFWKYTITMQVLTVLAGTWAGTVP